MDGGAWKAAVNGVTESYSKFPLVIFFAYGSVYVSMLLSPFVSLSPSPAPTLHIHKSVLYVCISIVVHIYNWILLSHKKEHIGVSVNSAVQIFYDLTNILFTWTIISNKGVV